jgi:hypothetical protein
MLRQGAVACDIVPGDTGKFRNVVPKSTEDVLKRHQLAAWENTI